MNPYHRTIACAAVAILCGASWAGDLYRGPYLQQATPESVVVVWRTDGTSTPVLKYGESPRRLNNVISGAAITTRVSVDVDQPGAAKLYKLPAADHEARDSSDHDPSTRENTYQFEAHVTGLPSGTKFYYAVYDGEEKLAGGDRDHYFVTSPPHGSEANLRLWVVGDSGTGDRDQAMVHDAMQEFTARTNRPLDAYLHVGDMAYGDGTDREFQHNFFEPYQETLRNTVCWPTMGNHEGHTSRGISGFGPYYDAYVVPTNGEAGGVPSGTEAYYSFDIANVHFVCLDSHDLDRDPSGAMAQWLRADLEQTQADWMIAFWHHPPYTKGSHDSDRETQLIEMRENFMPILEAGGVDLVLSGHSHIYERSMLIDGAYDTPTVAEGVVLDDGDGRPDGDGPYRKSAGLQPHEGTLAIVAGHGGAGVNRSGTMPVMRVILVEHGSVILDIDGNQLVGTMVDKQGNLDDVFALRKEGEVQVGRVLNPWQPEHDLSQITELLLDFQEDAPGTMPDNWELARGGDGKIGVAEASNGQKWLTVAASSTPVIGHFEPIQTRGFEHETYIRFPADGDHVAGLIFAYVDADNYWRVDYDLARDEVRATQVANGDETVVDINEADITVGEWMKFELECWTRLVEVQFNDDVMFMINPGGDLPKGQLGFYVAGDTTADFRYFELQRDLE